MTATLTIDGKSVPVGEIVLHFQYFKDDVPPYAWIDLVSDSKDDSLGGVAINCFDIGNVPQLSDLFGKTFGAGHAEDAEGAELSESVLWKPGDQTLELTSIEIKFGSLNDEYIPIELRAICFDHQGRDDIQVVLLGHARVHGR
jgi:hypothetical protein